eukprot:ANDGO_05622.mRNA.1 hypothetical protein
MALHVPFAKGKSKGAADHCGEQPTDSGSKCDDDTEICAKTSEMNLDNSEATMYSDDDSFDGDDEEGYSSSSEDEEIYDVDEGFGGIQFDSDSSVDHDDENDDAVLQNEVSEIDRVVHAILDLVSESDDSNGRPSSVSSLRNSSEYPCGASLTSTAPIPIRSHGNLTLNGNGAYAYSCSSTDSNSALLGQSPASTAGCSFGQSPQLPAHIMRVPRSSSKKAQRVLQTHQQKRRNSHSSSKKKKTRIRNAELLAKEEKVSDAAVQGAIQTDPSPGTFHSSVYASRTFLVPGVPLALPHHRGAQHSTALNAANARPDEAVTQGEHEHFQTLVHIGQPALFHHTMSAISMFPEFPNPPLHAHQMRRTASEGIGQNSNPVCCVVCYRVASMARSSGAERGLGLGLGHGHAPGMTGLRSDASREVVFGNWLCKCPVCWDCAQRHLTRLPVDKGILYLTCAKCNMHLSFEDIRKLCTREEQLLFSEELISRWTSRVRHESAARGYMPLLVSVVRDSQWSVQKGLEIVVFDEASSSEVHKCAFCCVEACQCTPEKDVLFSSFHRLFANRGERHRFFAMFQDKEHLFVVPQSTKSEDMTQRDILRALTRLGVAATLCDKCHVVVSRDEGCSLSSCPRCGTMVPIH